MIWTRKRHLCLHHILLPYHTKAILRFKTQRALYALGLCLLSLLLLLTLTIPSHVLLRHLWLLHWDASQVAMTAAATPSLVLRPDCQGLLQGDREEAIITKQMLYTEARAVVPDEYIINVTRNCKLYLRSKHYVNAPTCTLEQSFPIAFVIVVHKDIQQLEQLLSAIYVPQNVYCIHVDAKSSRELRLAVEGVSHCYPNMFVTSKLESALSLSHGFNRLTANINCMKELLASNTPWKYIINLAEQDFPLKTNLEITQYLLSLNGSNEIPGVVLKAQLQTDIFHYVYTTASSSTQRTSKLKSPLLDNVTLHLGSPYYFASRSFVQHILSDVTAQRLLAWLKDVQNPEDFYWATLQRLPHTPGGSTSTGWTERLRAVKGMQEATHHGHLSPGHRLHTHRQVYVYGVENLYWLTQQPQLFASRFDLDIDHVVLQCLLIWLEDKVKQQTTTAQ